MTIAVCLICYLFGEKVVAKYKTRSRLLKSLFPSYNEIFVCEHHNELWKVREDA